MPSNDKIKRSKRYDEDEHYRKYVEAEIKNTPSILSRVEAFYRLGRAWPGVKDTLLFPVIVLEARKSFGKLQCLITPLLAGDLARSSLGERWVDRKFLILQHDHEFRLYKKYLPKD